jgi:hypothetical protein
MDPPGPGGLVLFGGAGCLDLSTTPAQCLEAFRLRGIEQLGSRSGIADGRTGHLFGLGGGQLTGAERILELGELRDSTGGLQDRDGTTEGVTALSCQPLRGMAVAVELEGTGRGDPQRTDGLARGCEVLEAREQAHERLRVRTREQRGVEVPDDPRERRFELLARHAHKAHLL